MSSPKNGKEGNLKKLKNNKDLDQFIASNVNNANTDQKTTFILKLTVVEVYSDS